MNSQFKLILVVIGLCVAIAGGAYSTSAINDLADGFAQSRKTEVKFFAKLVKENWDGIKTVPEEKKQILLKNLDPELAAVDIYVLRSMLLVVTNLIFGVAVFLCFVASVRLWQTIRIVKNLPKADEE